MTTLVIVESPNKVRSIAGYLGDGYVVDSSVGHIRDLPDTKRNPVPAKFKGEPWVRLQFLPWVCSAGAGTRLLLPR